MNKMCEGCEKLSCKNECMVYTAPPGLYVRAGKCPINPPKVETKKTKTRGQRKQGRFC